MSMNSAALNASSLNASGAGSFTTHLAGASAVCSAAFPAPTARKRGALVSAVVVVASPSASAKRTQSAVAIAVSAATAVASGVRGVRPSVNVSVSAAISRKVVVRHAAKATSSAAATGTVYPKVRRGAASTIQPRAILGVLGNKLYAASLVSAVATPVVNNAKVYRRGTVSAASYVSCWGRARPSQVQQSAARLSATSRMRAEIRPGFVRAEVNVTSTMGVGAALRVMQCSPATAACSAQVTAYPWRQSFHNVTVRAQAQVSPTATRNTFAAATSVQSANVAATKPLRDAYCTAAVIAGADGVALPSMRRGVAANAAVFAAITISKNFVTHGARAEVGVFSGSSVSAKTYAAAGANILAGQMNIEAAAKSKRTTWAHAVTRGYADTTAVSSLLYRGTARCVAQVRVLHKAPDIGDVAGGVMSVPYVPRFLGVGKVDRLMEVRD